MRPIEGGLAEHVFAFDLDCACARRHDAHDGFEQGAFAHAIAPHEANGLAALHGEINAAQDVALAVIGVDATNGDEW